MKILLLWCVLFAISPVAAAAEPVAPSSAQGVDPLLGAYEGVRVALVDDKRDAALLAARTLATQSKDPGLAAAAEQVVSAKDLAAMRLAFGEYSRLLVLRYEASGPPAGLKVYFCPMATGYAYWLQAQAGLANPYMGQAMPHCGEGSTLKAAVKAASPVAN